MLHPRSLIAAGHVEQRTAMLAGVSHDLRTVLTRFKLQLALLDDCAEVEEGQRRLLSDNRRDDAPPAPRVRRQSRGDSPMRLRNALEKRRRLMAAWAVHCTGAGADKVVPLRA